MTNHYEVWLIDLTAPHESGRVITFHKVDEADDFARNLRALFPDMHITIQVIQPEGYCITFY